MRCEYGEWYCGDSDGLGWADSNANAAAALKWNGTAKMIFCYFRIYFRVNIRERRVKSSQLFCGFVFGGEGGGTNCIWLTASFCRFVILVNCYRQSL